MRRYDSFAMRTVCALLMAICLTTIGCSGNSSEKLPVYGIVNIDGAPVEDGTIVFVNLAKSSRVQTQIKNGKYSIPADRGLSPGEQIVSIEAYKQSTKKAANASGYLVSNTGLVEQVLPPKYNQKSELKVLVDSTATSEHDFDLSL